MTTQTPAHLVPGDPEPPLRLRTPLPKPEAKHLLRSLGPTRHKLRQRLGIVIRRVNEG